MSTKKDCETIVCILGSLGVIAVISALGGNYESAIVVLFLLLIFSLPLGAICLVKLYRPSASNLFCALLLVTILLATILVGGPMAAFGLLLIIIGPLVILFLLGYIIKCISGR